MGDKDRIVLDGIDRYQAVDPMYECVRVVLNCLARIHDG